MINVIGGSGFVGSYLIKELIDDYQVKNLDKKTSPFFNNITQLGNISKAVEISTISYNCDCVVLLAAEHKDNVSPISLYYDVNVKGTRNVLEKMDEFGVKKLIFTSSVAIYGFNSSRIDENFVANPFNHYGKSKLEAEKIIKEWYDKDPKGKSVTIIRPTVIFGERNRGNVYNLLKQVSKGNFIMIGNGENKKSMAYVHNVVSFIKKEVDTSPLGFHIYNYSEKEDLSMNELIMQVEKKLKIKKINLKIPYFLGVLGGYFLDLVSKTINRKFLISAIRIKKFCSTTQFDSSKAHANFNAPFSLRKGLDKTLEFEFLKKNKKDILFYTE